MNSFLQDLAAASVAQTQSLPSALAVTALAKSTDEVVPGAVFFALRGARADGHQFVTQALARGAVAIVVEDLAAVPPGIPAVIVDSSRKAWALACSLFYAQPSHHFKLVGITGTNGKTTCTFLLKQLWAAAGNLSGLVGTVCNYVGEEKFETELTTPDARELQQLFVRMQKAGVKFAAMEVSSIALDQYRTWGTRFAVALFTNFTQDHLDYHGTWENYFESKLRLFRDYGVEVAVVNVDDPAGARLIREGRAKRWVTFSTSGAVANYTVRQAEYLISGTNAQISTPEGIKTLVSPLIGRHNLENALGALAVAHATGLNLDIALQGIRQAHGAPGRLERAVSGTAVPNVFVDYAHSEDALRNVLLALRKLRGEGSEKIITVFGCGGDRDRGKRPKMAAVVAELSDVVVVTSDNPRTEDPEQIITEICAGLPAGREDCHRMTDRRAAIELALELASPADIVLIAGKGHEDYQIIGTTKLPFDDRKIVKEYYLCS